MRLLVTKTTQASPDGIAVLTYEAGTAYDMPAPLAEVFLLEGWGEEVRPVGPAETAALAGPEETKPARRKK